MLDKSIKEDAPFTIHEGGLIKEGYNETDYHPNTGATRMDSSHSSIDYSSRDLGNLLYVYGGKYFEMLERIENEVRNKHN